MMGKKQTLHMDSRCMSDQCIRTHAVLSKSVRQIQLSTQVWCITIFQPNRIAANGSKLFVVLEKLHLSNPCLLTTLAKFHQDQMFKQMKRFWSGYETMPKQHCTLAVLQKWDLPQTQWQ